MNVRGLVEAQLRMSKAPRPALDLWGEISRNFEEGGPEAVTALVEAKIRELKRRAKKEEAEIRAVAKKPKKSKARRKRRKGVIG